MESTFAPLETERLTLRTMTLDDAEDLAERRSDTTTAQYQAWRAPYSVDRARELIAEITSRPGPMPGHWYQLAVVRKRDGKVLGDVAVHLSPNGKTAEVGFTLHPWARGHHYATEATARLVDYAVFDLNVHRVEATTHPHNIASVRVLERIGFLAEGVRREAYWVDDEVSDDAIYGLLAREWRARRAQD
ncbi:GNAT family N-acetyltransferase [Demequina sp. B12]|uniref:GNAT family N-acetyltransferase n=1 Tax=Demequina sp. B12 TaxID=2992757 RepID=UPI00237C3E81|nr:GNAT family N-acetyltransferase [Demequina sp. B12]MDE0572045.1 GNAT family N-acetyltransferase [Demequina sp. B12]